MTNKRLDNSSFTEFNISGDKPLYLEMGIVINNSIYANPDNDNYQSGNCPAFILDYMRFYQRTKNVSMVQSTYELRDSFKSAQEICKSILSEINPAENISNKIPSSYKTIAFVFIISIIFVLVLIIIYLSTRYKKLKRISRQNTLGFRYNNRLLQRNDTTDDNYDKINENYATINSYETIRDISDNMNEYAITD